MSMNPYTYSGLNGLHGESGSDGSQVNEGRVKNMDKRNDVLNLWYDREMQKIENKYAEKELEIMNSNSLVKEYKELIENFENSMRELYEREDNEKHYIRQSYSEYSYLYNINRQALLNDFNETYAEQRDEDFAVLRETYKEIKAVLSLSDELEYQLDVLRSYGIIDKKNKMINK